MRLIDADKLFEKFRTTFPASEAFQILFQAPTVCDIEQIRAELVEDYESYSASEVNFDFACGIKRAIDTIDYHINHKAESEE